jgi:hypothetical protein
VLAVAIPAVDARAPGRARAAVLDHPGSARMSWNHIGRWVLLLASLALGLLAGFGGHWIFEAKIPKGAESRLAATEARIYYLGAGLALGCAIFGLTRIAVWVASRAAASRTRRERTPAGTGGKPAR